ncbi:MAG TPA: DNA polymerase III subunit delta [Chthoniobacteraceae bacterium]|nr:DNA polymerase III subunit delta [Chthoniobacteraceae bacterium]
MPRATATKPASSKAAAVRAVVGSDESEVKRVALQRSVEMAPKESGDLGIDVIDGAVDNVEQAITRLHQSVEAIQTLPFFGGEKLVWLKNANFLGDSVTGRSAGVVDAAQALIDLLAAGLPQGVAFLLSATEIDKRRSFYKTLGKIAAVEVFDKLDASRSGWEENAAGLVRDQAEKAGLQLRGDALELFVLLTGGDSRQIRNELEKLDLYLGTERREVTLEDLRLMVPPSRAGVIFELGNALAARDLNQALGRVEQLLFQGESAVGILLVAIIPTVRNLLLAKDLMDRYRLSRPAAPFHFAGALKRLPADATGHLPRKKDGTLNTYALGIAATGAHRFTLPELHRALEACLEANVELVTSGLDAATLLTELIVRIAAPGPSRPLSAPAAPAAPRRRSGR